MPFVTCVLVCAKRLFGHIQTNRHTIMRMFFTDLIMFFIFVTSCSLNTVAVIIKEKLLSRSIKNARRKR